MASHEDELARLRGELLAAQLTVRELRERNAELAKRVDAEQSTAKLFAQQLQDLRHSRSWNVTTPLRVVMRRTRG